MFQNTKIMYLNDINEEFKDAISILHESCNLLITDIDFLSLKKLYADCGNDWGLVDHYDALWASRHIFKHVRSVIRQEKPDIIISSGASSAVLAKMNLEKVHTGPGIFVSPLMTSIYGIKSIPGSIGRKCWWLYTEADKKYAEEIKSTAKLSSGSIMHAETTNGSSMPTLVAIENILRIITQSQQT